jgi:GNAT superfamily N-acetyltransferase
MQYRLANSDDAGLLAELNYALIHDEGHRNRMSIAELTSRMAEWLAGEYQAVVFEADGRPVGYALFRRDPEHIYLRQFFVAPEWRRRGVGRSAMEWLRQHAWGEGRRVRVDVLVGNSEGIAFWRAVGFEDYCLTLEMEGRNGSRRGAESAENN